MRNHARIRSSGLTLARLLLAVIISSPVMALQSTPPAATGAPQQLPWFIQLGQRVALVHQRMAVEDRVVLVPDEATFLDEITKWRLSLSAQDQIPGRTPPDPTRGCWPVLIEDPVYTPMFIRAFKPKQVIRRTERAAPLTDDAAVATAIDTAVVRVWLGDPATQKPKDALLAQRQTPPGLAGFAASDPAWVAAAALAAGRGLIPAAIPGDFGGPNGQLDAATFARLNQAVTDAFAATGMSYQGVGDELDAIALCRATAQKAVIDVPPAQRPSGPGMPPVNPAEPVAVTDALCRDADGKRYAYCGAIFGTAPQAAYAAMSSMFLRRSDVLCVDSYSDAPSQFARYGFQPAREVMQRGGWQSRLFTGVEALLGAWRQRAATGLSCDVMFVNTSGNADFFDLGTPGKTPASNQGGPGDIPVLSRPLALSWIHSWSLTAPGSRDTIGGRWLEHGVYAYVGSVQEPYLVGFVPPVVCIELLVNLTPFAVAARYMDGPFALPWRIATLGDPLMLCAGPQVWSPPARIAPTPMVPGQENAMDRCRDLLEKARQDVDGAATASAMQALSAIGQDAIAAGLWKLAAVQPWAARVAPMALEPLFAVRDMDGFLKAYGLTPSPSDRNKDMLWQMWGPALGSVRDPEQLMLFERSVRRVWPSKDWQRLVQPMERSAGADRTRAAMLKTMQGVSDEQQKKAMQDLLSQV
jgi:hypothetical protein